ncbi:hypothetical protein CDIK_3442 [Cucumispora dikerogammari]|nr:hypothetical protein CDIK_3442 [Cucumispora dikerogammari]
MRVFYAFFSALLCSQIQEFIKTHNNETLTITTILPKTLISTYQLECFKGLFEHFNINKKNWLSTYGDTSHTIIISKLVNNKKTVVGGCFLKEFSHKFRTALPSTFKISTNPTPFSDKSPVIFTSEQTLNQKSHENECFTMNIIYCLYVYPDFRNKGISNFLLNFIESFLPYDMLSLCVNPASDFNAINFYTYFKHNYNHIDFIKVNPPELFMKPLKCLLDTKCLNIEDLEKNLNRIYASENINAKYVILSKLKTISDLSKVRISKEEIFKTVEKFFTHFKKKLIN